MKTQQLLIWLAIFTEEDPAKKGAVSARQPCYHVPAMPNLGQWLCVPPFRVVCLLRVLRLNVKNTEIYMQKLCKIIPFLQ